MTETVVDIYGIDQAPTLIQSKMAWEFYSFTDQWFISFQMISEYDSIVYVCILLHCEALAPFHML